MNIKEIFYEVINEVYSGKVIIDSEEWQVGFNTIIYNNNEVELELLRDNNLSTLVIKDLNEFLRKLENYLETELEKNRKAIKYYREPEKNKLKLLIIYLFVNATVNDFLNPLEYLDRLISFLEDDTFSYLNNGVFIPLNELFFGSYLKIQNTLQSVLMETPNKIELTLESLDGEIYKLPTISYGIEINSNGQKECYIYSILNDKNTLDSKFGKKISRLLYKLNKGVSEVESPEYFEFKEGISSYYSENISDVSPSSILSLIIFFSLLKKEGIEKIKVVPYLPLRYLSRSLFADSKTGLEKENLIKRNNEIQNNITDKFIRTFRRVSYHLDGLEITSFPYELSEFLELNLGSNKTYLNNSLLNEVNTSIDKKL